MPRQLANRPRAHPPPHTLSRLPHAGVAEYPVLPTVSRGCPGAGGRLPTCYSAVRHSIRAPKGALTVRLACVRRAASVHPEPGSNSPFKVPGGSCRRASRLVRPSRPKIPLISDSLKLTSLCVRDSNFAGLSSSISRSQYPVFKVRRAGRGRLPRRCAGINYTHPAAPRGRDSRGSRFLHNWALEPETKATVHQAILLPTWTKMSHGAWGRKWRVAQ